MRTLSCVCVGLNGENEETEEKYFDYEETSLSEPVRIIVSIIITGSD